MIGLLRAAPLVILAGAVSLAGKLEVALVKPQVIQERLAAGEVKPNERQSAIRKLFADVGCAAGEQPVDKKSGNVICILPGETASEIIVGGHFDFVDRGRGIVDDWSGASLLPSLYQAIRNQPRRHTYVFVAFAAEERGLVGSTRFVKNLTAERKPGIRAFVNLECLGLTPAKVWARRSSKELITALVNVAHAIDVPLQGMNVDKVGDDDTHPFAEAHIPVITIHSVTQETLPILHSPQDRLQAVHPDDYYNAYRLAAFYLAYLDTTAE